MKRFTQWQAYVSGKRSFAYESIVFANMSVCYEQMCCLFVFTAAEWFNIYPLLLEEAAVIVFDIYQNVLLFLLQYGYLTNTAGWEFEYVRESLKMFAVSENPCKQPQQYLVRRLTVPSSSMANFLRSKGLLKSNQADADYIQVIVHPFSHMQQMRRFNKLFRHQRKPRFIDCRYCAWESPCMACNNPQTNKPCGVMDSDRRVRCRCSVDFCFHFCNAHGQKIMCPRKSNNETMRHRKFKLNDGRVIKNKSEILQMKADTLTQLRLRYSGLPFFRRNISKFEVYFQSRSREERTRETAEKQNEESDLLRAPTDPFYGHHGTDLSLIPTLSVETV